MGQEHFFSPCGPVALRPNAGQVLLVLEVSRSRNYAPQSLGLLWTRDELVAETSTWQYMTLTTGNPCPRRNSKPQSQQASDRKHTR